MKNLLLLALTATLLGACQNIDGFFKNENDSTNSAAGGGFNSTDAHPARDYSITPDIAFNNLFLDSIAVENFVAGNKLSSGAAQSIRDFYNRRNYQYAWFSADGITEQGRGFWGLQQSEGDETKETKQQRKLRAAIDSLIFNDSLTVTASDSNILQNELALTQEFIRYSAKNSSILQPGVINFLLPAKKVDALQMADSLLSNATSPALAGNKIFQAYKPHLRQYYNAVKGGAAGGAIVVSTADSVSKDTAATANRKTGNVNKNNKRKADSLQRKQEAATAQQATTLSAQPVLDSSQVLQLLLVNIYRSFWMPADTAQKYISVNIPSFMLYAYDSGRKVLEMPVVVGKEGTSTTMFAGDINQVVFSPYWNIPESIVEKEIMPEVEKNPNYLQRKNMERVGEGQLRQRPGADNPLGKAKFLFPNSFDIYLHDSPNKGLFTQQNRAASHGCIRVGDATALANFILRAQSEWTPDKVKSSMAATEEKYVKVANPVRVNITYYTAWVDEAGKLKLANDVYGLDNKEKAMMFLAQR